MSTNFTGLVDILRKRASRRPGDTAYIFLDDSGSEHRMSNAELDAAAGAIAARLSAHNARGERALLLFPPGLEYVAAFFGCLRAGVVAVPAYPPMDPRTAARVNGIVADASARFALTSADLLSAAQGLITEPLVWPAAGTAAEAFDAPSPEPDSLAFLQYTSGSTRAPRGVMLTHANLMHNLAAMHASFAGQSDDVVVSWLPPYHDMGLIGAILEPMYGEFPAVLMSPLRFLRDPGAWLRAISDHRGTISPSPNFGYELCVRRVDDAQAASLDLSSWRAAINGAEPVRASTMRRFTERFTAARFDRNAFRPSYGLAEATLLVSCDPLGTATPVIDDDRPVPCGTVRGGQDLVVVDTGSLAVAQPGAQGEIWLSGDSVAAGYWGKPAETEALFRATLPDGRGPFLRTGDLGSLDEDGALTVAGRLKDLVIIGGRNIHPHDVEQAAEEGHRALRPGCGAAFGVPVDGEERLVLVFEVVDGADVDEVATACRRAVFEQHAAELHELVLIEARTIPKTSSGKIRRAATRDAYLAGALTVVGGHRARPREQAGFVAPRSPLEELIAEIWADLLDVEAVGVHDDFLASGAQSLLLARLAARLEAELPVRVTAGDVFEAPTVAKLAELLAARPMLVPEDRVADLMAPHETR